MKFSRLHSALLRGGWLIEHQFAQSHIPLIARLIQGQSVDFRPTAGEHTDEKNARDQHEAPWMRCLTIGIDAGAVKASRYNSFKEAPEGSIAMIPVTGPILKYGGDCGEAGSVHMTEWVNQAKAASNISGIILKIDSPGGQVDGTASLADAITNAGKPVIAFLDDGMMCSAAMWVGSSANKIYASQKTDTIGSIGVYTTLMDFRGMLEKEGIKLHEIYAPQSTEKNKDYREALKGKYALIEEDLKFICDEFISVIRANRPGVNADYPGIFNGATYRAEQAMEAGLIDDIKSLEDVIREISASANGSGKKGSYNSKSQNTMFGNKLKKTAALKDVTADALTEEQLNSANEELKAEGIVAAQLVSVKDIDQAQKNESDLSKAQASVAAKDKEIASLKVSVAEWKGKAEEYGAKDGAEATSANSKGDKTERYAETENHNRAKTEAEAEREKRNEVDSFDFKTSKI